MLAAAEPGRHLPAEHPVRQGRGLGLPAPGSAAADHRQEAEVLRHRRLRGGPRHRHGRAHQHHHADLLLRHLRRAAPRGGHRPDQEGHQEDLRQEGRGRGQEELRGGGHTPWPTSTRSRCPPRSPPPGPCRPPCPPRRPDFVQRVTAIDDGRQRRPAARSPPSPSTAPGPPAPPSGRSATSPWTSRSGTSRVCIQCNKCSLICPHAAIRPKVSTGKLPGRAPRPPSSRVDYKGAEFKGMKYTLQVAPEDCTGCGICVAACPAKDKSEPRAQGHQHGRRSRRCATAERGNYDFFLEPARPGPDHAQARRQGQPVHAPAVRVLRRCAGCGETPYIKLLTQLFGDRALIANATGCSSIYGGNLPTTPY